jgi:hypothetical protein
VDHSVTVEPVVAAARVELRIGSVADVDPVQVVGNLADDVEVCERDLLARRRKGATEIGVGGGELALQGLYVEADRRILVNPHASLRESTNTSPKLVPKSRPVRAGTRRPTRSSR